MDSEGSGSSGRLLVALIAHVALLVLVFIYWVIAQTHPCHGLECAYVNAAVVGSFVASGCVLLAAVMNWPKWLLVRAAGTSVLAVVAACSVGWDFILPVPTIMLTVLPSGLAVAKWRSGAADV